MTSRMIQRLLEAKAQQAPLAEHILLYGPPGAGKTCLALSLCEHPAIKRVIWFDLEAGFAPIIYAMKPSQETLSKITLINVEDTKQIPNAAITLLHSFTAPSKVNLCEEHGALECPNCQPIQWHLKEMGPNDLVVIDSLTQVGQSIYNATTNRKHYKDNRKAYGDAGIDLMNLLLAIQASPTNILCIARDIRLEDEDGRLLGIYPQVLSSSYSRNVAGNFSQVIYAYQNLGQFYAGSGPDFLPNVITRSRTNRRIEDYDHPDLKNLFGQGLPEQHNTTNSSNPTIKVRIT